MNRRTAILIPYYLLAIPIMVGFYFHESSTHQVLTYSYKYATFLLFITLALGVLLPLFGMRFVHKHGIKVTIFSLIPSGVSLLVVYLFFSVTYYHEREHRSLFDPFLQIHKQDIDASNFHEEDFIVLTLGGSTTKNNHLPAEDRYPTLLEKQLQDAYPSRNVKVVDGSMDWYTTKHSLINYATYYRVVKPDLVIIMHAINDLYRSFSPKQWAIGEYNTDYSHFYGPAIRGAAERTTFERYCWNGINNTWFSSLRSEKVLQEHDFKMDAYKSLDAYQFYLKTLIKDIRQDSSVCLLVEQAYLYKEKMNTQEKGTLWFGNTFCVDEEGKYASTASLHRAMQSYNAVAKRLAEDEKVEFVTVKNRMESTLSFFTDDVHYTKKGTKTLAATVTNFIKDSVDIPTLNKK